MFTRCSQCGSAAEDHADYEADYFHCRACGHRWRFRREPLLVVSGAAGSGKSTLIELLAGTVDAVLLDQDIFWFGDFRSPEDGYRALRDVWMLLVANIWQNGMPSVIFGSAEPSNYEERARRRFFSSSHFVALVCDDELLRERLRLRPLWRGWDEDRIQLNVDWNHHLRKHAPQMSPPMILLDTSTASPEECAQFIRSWLDEVLRTS